MGFISKEEFIAGTIAGWAQVLSGQPFDNTKFRMQGAATNMGVIDTLKIMIAEGPKTFYKGMMSPLVGVGIAVSIQFGTSKTIKKILASNSSDGKTTYTHSFIAGVVAGIFNTIVITPVEHIRIKVSKAHPHPNEIYKGSGDAFKRILNEHGVKGLFKGQTITTMREAWSYGLYFMIYDFLIKSFSPVNSNSNDKPSNLVSLSSGGLTGLFMWTLVYPLDILKTRIQLDSFTQPKYTGIAHAYKEIATKGYSSFYHGFFPVAVRAIPVNAITFAAYEIAFDFIRSDKLKH